MNITWKGCHANNFGVGRSGNKIDKIVVHWIVGTLASANTTFQNPDRKASAHYGVGGSKIFQWVKEEDTAWHASNLTVNRQSIGIEHEGGPDIPISEETYKASAELIKDICKRHNIPLDRNHIKGHKEFANTQCPGTLDIDKLISLAKIEPMTEEQKRILQFLSEQKANEGKVREAFGALADIPKLKKEIENLKVLSENLSVKVLELSEQLALEQEQGVVWQKEISSANKKIQNLESEMNTLAKERNQYKKWYEDAKAELRKLDKMTPWQHIKHGVKLLSIKK